MRKQMKSLLGLSLTAAMALGLVACGSGSSSKSDGTSNSAKNSLGSNLVSPILNTGKISANVNSAKNNKELAEINYKKTVQQAFQEVYDILNKRDIILQDIEHQKAHYTNMSEIFRITQNSDSNA